MIYIKGIIGNEDGEVNLPFLIEQVKSQTSKDAMTDLHVVIDSIGGDPEVGFAMYNYLRTLPNKITTECVNNCASAATLPFLAGDIRIAGCPIMIHNPYIEGISGDKRTLEAAAQWIGEKERECERIYTERTTLDSTTLSRLMDDETYITPGQAFTFGFATQKKIIALAKLNKTNINKNAKQMSKKRSIRAILALGLKAKAMDLTALDGSILTVQRTDGTPQVGDEATPDGTFDMPDGSVITVVDGIITEITVPAKARRKAKNEDDVEKEENMSPVDADEIMSIIQELIQENETLKKENEELKSKEATARARAKSADDVVILNAIAKAGGKKWLAKQCSHYKPQARIGRTGKMEAQGRQSNVAQKLSEIKEKRGIN